MEPFDSCAIERARRFYKLGRLGMRSRRIPRDRDAGGGRGAATRDYELFFPVFNHPFEPSALAAVPDWRSRRPVAARFVSAFGLGDPQRPAQLLADFYYVFIGISHPAKEVGRASWGRPCTYLPLATNVVRFAPWPKPPPRAIDVCNIGRRSAVTHAAW